MMKTLAAAAALALTAGAASAFTISPASNIAPGGTYDLADGPFAFYVSFFDSPAGTFSFTFENSSSTSSAVTATAASLTNDNFFPNQPFNGLTIGWASDVAAMPINGTFPGGTVGLFKEIAANSSDTLNVNFGARLPGEQRVSLQVLINSDVAPAAVPVPAAGIMLAGALAGVAALRRRKA